MGSPSRYRDDDGRTVADMSDVGNGAFLRPMKGQEEHPAGSRDVREEISSSEERLMVIPGTLRAALSIGLVYVVVFAIVIAVLVAFWT